jgi:hypothetical protein
MQQYTIYEREGNVDLVISYSDDLNQSCLAAWSRADRESTLTWVLDTTTGECVDEYDCRSVGMAEVYDYDDEYA